MKFLGLLGAVGLGLAIQSMPTPALAQDALQWLEDPHGEHALQWARQATEQTRQKLGALPSHEAVSKEIKQVLVQAPSEPDRVLLGSRAVRLLRDAENPYGLLQVAPRDEAGATAAWTTVLDVAELRKREGVPYELQMYTFGSSCLAPEYTRCLLRLSPGGGDEVELREFDLSRAQFVADGFHVPKSRAFINWMSRDQVLVAHVLDDSPKTIAGWPVAFRLWTRGQPLDAAKIVFQAEPSDAIVQAYVVHADGKPYAVIARAIDYSTYKLTIVDSNGERRPVPLPEKLKPMGVLAASGSNILFQLTRDETLEGVPYQAESLLSFNVDPRVAPAERIARVYAPADGEFLDAGFSGVASDGQHVFVVLNKNLRQRVVAFHPQAHGWSSKELLEAAPGETIAVSGDTEDGRGVVAAISGFVTPRTQYVLGPEGQRRQLAQDPSVIDAKGYVSEVGSARSKDGTKIDYFLLRPARANGPVPLLMTGYGAFGLSFRPGYFDYIVGGPALKVWLERGGAVAIPAIRGGGERGEAWHQAALREKRQNSYDDFIAAAEHLIRTGVTTQGHVGLFGSSNGGLLAATLGTQRPDLFSAVVSDVPLTDLIRMRHMGMGAAWMNEYGNPDVPAQAQAMLGYSPYQNVHEGKHYAPFLVTISTEDNRVGPGHARKFAHRLADVGATAYFYEDEEGGHGVSDALRNPELMALRMSFFIDTLMSAKK